MSNFNNNYCISIFLLLGTFKCGNCFANVTNEPDAPNQISIYDIKVDICYWVTRGRWPPCLGPNQIAYRTSLKSKLFHNSNGTNLNDTELANVCKNYEANSLDPDNKLMDFEFCWYAKYGMWRQAPLTRIEETLRQRMIDEHLYENDQRIPRWKVCRLCPNFNNMECKECALAIEKNCYYARYGRWKNKAPSISYQRKFFYTGAKRIGIKELIKKCPQYFDKICKTIHYPNCSGKK